MALHPARRVAGVCGVSACDDCPSAIAAAVCCVPPCAPYVTVLYELLNSCCRLCSALASTPLTTCLLCVAMRLSQGGPLALRLAKQAISLGAELDLSSGLKLEEACYAQVGRGGAMRVWCVVSVHPWHASAHSARCTLPSPPAQSPRPAQLHAHLCHAAMLPLRAHRPAMLPYCFCTPTALPRCRPLCPCPTTAGHPHQGPAGGAGRVCGEAAAQVHGGVMLATSAAAPACWLTTSCCVGMCGAGVLRRICMHTCPSPCTAQRAGLWAGCRSRQRQLCCVHCEGLPMRIRDWARCHAR